MDIIYDLPIDDSAVCCYITLINNASWRTRQASRKEAGAEKQAGIAHPGRTQKETKRKGEPRSIFSQEGIHLETEDNR